MPSVEQDQGLETFQDYMTIPIMREVISIYEKNRSKGLADDVLYSFLIQEWMEIVKRSSQTVVDEGGGGCCGGGSKKVVYPETPPKKEGGGGCCGSTSESNISCAHADRENVAASEYQPGSSKENLEKCCGSGVKCAQGVNDELNTKCCCEVKYTQGPNGELYTVCCCSTTSGPPKRFFLVDDSLVSCKLTKKTIESCSHTLTATNSGKEAVSILAKANTACKSPEDFPYDVIFLDIVMPEMDGLEVLDCMRSMPNLSTIPVVMLSALEDDDLLEKCHKMGAFRVLQKPLQCSNVKDVLDSIERSSLQKVFAKKCGSSSICCSATSSLDRALATSTKQRRGKSCSMSSVCTSSTSTLSIDMGHSINFGVVEPLRTTLNHPSKPEIGRLAPTESIMVRNRKGRMVEAIPKGRVSTIVFIPSQCDLTAVAISDLLFVIMDVAREQGRVGEVVSLVFVTPEEENVVIPEEVYTYVYTYSFASHVMVGKETWEAFLGVTHYAAGVVVVDGEGITAFSWSSMVDHNGNLVDSSNFVSRDELMSAVFLATRRTLLGASVSLRGKDIVQQCELSPPQREGTEGIDSIILTKTSSDECMMEINPITFNILVVDDCLMSCKLSVRKLQSLGFSVEYVLNGMDAIELLRKKPGHFHLVLLDIVMPDVDGMEVLFLIQSHSDICDVPVIMLSGLVENEALTKNLVDAGARGVLRKPLDEEEVANQTLCYEWVEIRHFLTIES